MTDYNPSQCYACERKDKQGLTCEAFPDGIPDLMLLHGGDHRIPLLGDGGKQFMIGDFEEAEQNFEYWQQVFGPQ